MRKNNAAIVIRPKSVKERVFIEDLLAKLGVNSMPVSEDDLLDLGLARMMRDVDRSKRVANGTAMKILAS